jgi:hypothetical protein
VLEDTANRDSLLTYTLQIILLAIPDFNHPDSAVLLSTCEGIVVLAFRLSSCDLSQRDEKLQEARLVSGMNRPGGVEADLHLGHSRLVQRCQMDGARVWRVELKWISYESNVRPWRAGFESCEFGEFRADHPCITPEFGRTGFKMTRLIPGEHGDVSYLTKQETHWKTRA